MNAHADLEVEQALQAQDLGSLAARANAEHEAAFGRLKDALEHARRAGEALIQAKTLCKHGEFLQWIEANCHFSRRSAQLYMRVARDWALVKNAGIASL